VRLGDKPIGFLQTGQVFTEKPDSAKVDRAVAKARAMGVEEKPDVLRNAYLQTPVIPKEKFQSTLRLLTTFGDLLALKSNQIVVTQSNAENPIVAKAKQIIEERHSEELSLGQVAQEVHVSSYHLCKLFRKSTGITFTEFVSRTRTEKAKNLLLNPQLRVSEIVYEVGFQSLTHFNRIFKKLVGESPTRFRSRIPGHRPKTPLLGNCFRRKSGVKVLPQFA
jgi:YesN/AraC family two-component response regulator